MAVLTWIILDIVRAFAWPSDHKSAGQFVFQTREELNKVWVADGGLEADMPAVDFDKETVVAVFSGQKNSGGYSIQIDRILSRKSGREETIIVLFRETAPAPGSMQTRALTFPGHAVVIQKSMVQYKFVNEDSDEAKEYKPWLEKK